MHDATRVRELEAGTDLVRDAQRLVERHSMLRRVLDEPLDIAATHELGHHERLAIAVAEVEDGDDVRVCAKPSHRLRFARHARA